MEPVWHFYEYERPQQDLPIILRCPGRDGLCYHEFVVVPRDLDPEVNVSGLRWRPTGIFKRFKGKIAQLGGQQANAYQNQASNLLSSLLGSAEGQSISSYLAYPEIWHQDGSVTPRRRNGII